MFIASLCFSVLIPPQEPALERTPIERPASRTEQFFFHQALARLAEAAKSASFTELRRAERQRGSESKKFMGFLSSATNDPFLEFDERRRLLWKHISPLLHQSQSPQARANAFYLLDSPWKRPVECQFDEVEFLLENPAVTQIFINQLKDDDVRMNHERFARLCCQYFKGFRFLLEEAMSSEDDQLRRFAINLVSNRTFLDPSPETLEIQKISGSWDRMDYLIHYKDYYRDYILEEFYDNHSFVAAQVIALSRWPIFSSEVTELLVEHLKDDDIPGNASEASRALFIMGDVALPYLYDIQIFDDEQQKAYVELLIWDITDPPLDYADLRLRRSKLCSDLSKPIVETYFQSWQLDPVLQGPAWGSARGRLHWLDRVKCHCSHCKHDDYPELK